MAKTKSQDAAQNGLSPGLFGQNFPAPADQPIRITTDGAYLITGGLGGLGLKVAQWLAEQGAGHLVLIGRHGLPEKEEWSALSKDHPKRNQIAAIEAIRELGTKVHVEAAM